jgi:hypothetical protein
MLYTDFSKISILDIQELITNSVAENKTLEYKQELKMLQFRHQMTKKKNFLPMFPHLPIPMAEILYTEYLKKNSIPKDIKYSREHYFDGL